MTSIAIIDYGMGNLRSVEKAFERAGTTAVITNDLDQIRASDGVVLPGVGAFPRAMENIRKLELDGVIGESLAAGVPFLGICLGLQLIFESSDELGGAWGLGLLQGAVSRLNTDQKVPHIGWNTVKWSEGSALTAGLPKEEPFYFVHSFAPTPLNEGDILGTCEYGQPFVCAVEHGPLYAIQFHPEKSSTHGIKLLSNFAAICASAGQERGGT